MGETIECSECGLIELPHDAYNGEEGYRHCVHCDGRIGRTLEGF